MYLLLPISYLVSAGDSGRPAKLNGHLSLLRDGFGPFSVYVFAMVVATHGPAYVCVSWVSVIWKYSNGVSVN